MDEEIKDRNAAVIKKRIKELCRVRGITFNELAARLGLGSGIALHTNIRKGNMRLVTLQRIADALGVSVVELLADDTGTDKAPAQTTQCKGLTLVCPKCGSRIELLAAVVSDDSLPQEQG
jgi:transcriptional regulator with XRE-family HTH domain